MRHFARTSFGMLALGLIAPITVSAQTYESSSPAGYQPAGSSQPAMGMDGKPMMAPAQAPAMPAQAPAGHVHKGKKMCAACAAKANGMPPGKVVGCAHSKNGVCSACQVALDAPGTFVTNAATPAPAQAPGRAVASSGTMGQAGSPMGYDASMGDPSPVGVVQAGFSQSNGGMPMQPAMGMNPAGMPMSAPGRAVAESAPGRDPYQKKSGSFPHPHILGHLFGWSGIGSERREERAFKKSEAHAMMTYDPNAPTAVNELPASTVFGKSR